MKLLSRIIVIIILSAITFSVFLNYRLSYEVRAGVIESYEDFFCFDYDNFGIERIIDPKIDYELNRFTKYLDNSRKIFFFVLFISVLITIVLLMKMKFLDIVNEYQKWWLPFSLIIISWMLIIMVYIIFHWWSEIFFYNCFNNSAHIFSGYGFENPGSLFRLAWRTKNLLLIASFIFYIINRKIGIKKLSSLFVIIFIIDLTIGNLVVSVLHDSIDYLNPFWDFGPLPT